MCELGGNMIEMDAQLHAGSDSNELLEKISTLLGVEYVCGDCNISKIIKKLEDIRDSQTDVPVKGCPFCGGPCSLGQICDGVYVAKCGTCYGEIMGKTLNEAVHKWNALPRGLRWRRNPPTEEGWYWAREGRGEPRIIYHCAVCEYRSLVEFAGPIPCPEEK